MRPLLVVAFALLCGCRSTRQAMSLESDSEVEIRIEKADQSKRNTLTNEQKDVLIFVEEVLERVIEPTDTAMRPKVTEKRSRRKVEIDRSTLAELVTEQKAVDSTAVVQAVEHTDSEVAVEVEDSTPRNLRWLGILGISVAAVAICLVVLRFKK